MAVLAERGPAILLRDPIDALHTSSPVTDVEAAKPNESSVSLEPGDAPCVRDLLMDHFQVEDIEVEGKLGRWSKDRFTAGVSAEQFAFLEKKLQDLAANASAASDADALLGLTARASSAMPAVEVTLDRFHLLDDVLDSSKPAGLSTMPRPDGEPRGRRGKRCSPMVRASFTCDSTASSSTPHRLLAPPRPQPSLTPYEVLQKSRLADCYVAQAPNERTPEVRSRGSCADTSACPVSLRVSFSREKELPKVAIPSAAVYERLKRRRTWQAHYWQIALTHVTIDDGPESYEVEVELCMKAVRSRLEVAEPRCRRDEALLITRELVAALRRLAEWASEVPCALAARKRRRIEEAQAADPFLRKAMEAPEVIAELHRRVSAGRENLHEAKEELCRALRSRCPPGKVEEAALLRFAGQQVARALRRVHLHQSPSNAKADGFDQSSSPEPQAPDAQCQSTDNAGSS